MSAEPDGYTKWVFPKEGPGHEVYTTGQGPNVVVLHELFGLTDPCLKLGLHLARNIPAKVHLPLLFGPVKPNSIERLKNGARACISKEIHMLARNETSPIVGWCRALCDQLKADDPSYPGVAVVGMCLTGGFALALIANASVRGGVVAQPSLPLFIHRASLGLTDDDVSDLVKGADQHEGQCVLGLRHERDFICPSQRMATIRTLLGPRFKEWTVPGCGHSTLTAGKSEGALQETIAFLSERLGVAGKV